MFALKVNGMASPVIRAATLLRHDHDRERRIG